MSGGTVRRRRDRRRHRRSHRGPARRAGRRLGGALRRGRPARRPGDQRGRARRLAIRPAAVGGAELAAGLIARNEELGVTLVPSRIDAVEPGPIKTLSGAGGSWRARQVIVATGARLRTLDVPGAERLAGPWRVAMRLVRWRSLSRRRRGGGGRRRRRALRGIASRAVRTLDHHRHPRRDASAPAGATSPESRTTSASSCAGRARSSRCWAPAESRASACATARRAARRPSPAAACSCSSA